MVVMDDAGVRGYAHLTIGKRVKGGQDVLGGNGGRKINEDFDLLGGVVLYLRNLDFALFGGRKNGID